MKRKNIIAIIIVLMSLTSYAQDFVYANYSFDANKAFHLKENDRTKEDVYGLDYDIEVGARYKQFGIYMFYGQFEKAGFVNYGAGVDYYTEWFRWIDTSIGVAYSPVKQKDFRSKYDGVGMYSARAVTTIWFHPDSPIGLSLRLLLQNRTDVSKGYILEGSIGITIRL